MDFGEALLGPIAKRRDGGRSDVGIGHACLSRPHDGLELLHADLKSPVVGPAASLVEDVLLVVEFGQAAREICRHVRCRGQGTVERRRQHRIQQQGAPGEVGGEAGRAAHDGGHQVEQGRV
jgi:hypothetical protein